VPIQLERQGNTGPVILLLLIVAVAVGLVVIGFIDFCPEGFVRDCVHAVWGYFSDFACECMPISPMP
jgi:hypothetical protein